ncbi:MAG: hypothetical protein ACI4OA_01785 [Selenomonadaceae bacterium]
MADKNEEVEKLQHAEVKNFMYTAKQKADLEEVAKQENMTVEELFAKLVTDSLRSEES